MPFSFELQISVPSDPEHQILTLPGLYDDRCHAELWSVVRNVCQLGLDLHIFNTEFYEGEDEE